MAAKRIQPVLTRVIQIPCIRRRSDVIIHPTKTQTSKMPVRLTVAVLRRRTSTAVYVTTTMVMTTRLIRLIYPNIPTAIAANRLSSATATSTAASIVSRSITATA